ncbi:MAG: efflux RND transporter periplasmic adaptor subunit [Pseudomonadota bacterium]
MISRNAKHSGLWMKSLLVLLIAGAGIWLMSLPLAAQDQSQSQQDLPKVTVAYPTTMDIADAITFTGTVAASQSVDLVARVEGYLEQVYFEDGSFVEEGQLLFTIEPDQYEQNLLLNLAAYRSAEQELERQRAMLAENATSVASLENAQSQRDQAAAQVRLSEINLGYTIVSAPFSGRIGPRLVDPGNLVGASGSPTVIATLDRLQPIYVNFNLNERDALRVREMVRQETDEVIPGVGFAPVYIGLSNETGYPHEGTLDFVSSTVDASTGTIQMRGVFPNYDRLLFPGLFVRVRIPISQPKPTLMVPNLAVGEDQQGRFVLVVSSDDVVQRKAVETGPLEGSLRAITSGISADDRVVVNGLVNAKVGAKVAPQEQQATSATSETQ